MSARREPFIARRGGRRSDRSRRYAAQISDDYTVVGHPNGGYSSALGERGTGGRERRGIGPRPHHGHHDELRHGPERRSGGTAHQSATSGSERHVRSRRTRPRRSGHVRVTGHPGHSRRRRHGSLPPRRTTGAGPLEECLRRTVVEEIKLMSVVDFRLDPRARCGWTANAATSRR